HPVVHHDDSARVDEPLAVAPGDDRRLEDSWMSAERRFDLRRRDPHAGDFQHVVRAAREVEVPVVVAPHHVAGPEPLALHRRARALEPLPVARRRRLPANQQMSDGPDRHRLPVAVYEPRFETRHELAARAAAYLARAIRDEVVERLRGPDDIHELEPEAALPRV